MKKDGFKPPIVVVGTHIDQLQDVEEGIVRVYLHVCDVLE